MAEKIPYTASQAVDIWSGNLIDNDYIYQNDKSMPFENTFFGRYIILPIVFTIFAPFIVAFFIIKWPFGALKKLNEYLTKKFIGDANG